ncbi:MAG: 1-acyl-sn-glycerol-3-phosphate acyltransferase [Myxococcota bacterium]|nr:1-acyl-sn-glycerol-3-phosphate acyltransferase [Myxococcota bacterium]
MIFRGRLRMAARIGGFGALTAAMLPALLARQRMAREDARPQVRARWVMAWSSMLLRMFGVRMMASPVPSWRTGPGHLIVANHRSTADVLILLRAFGGHMVSRADLARWPLLGKAARSVGTVFVDRSDAVSGANAVRSMRALLARGSTVIVFPEGTTFPGDDVRPFHPGAFVAAARSRAEIVPVGLAYQAGSGAAFVNESFRAHLVRMAAADASDVAMCVGEPISVASDARAAALRDLTHASVQRLVHEARGIVDART